MADEIPVKKTDQLQIEIVDEDGHSTLRRPVNIEDILNQKDHTLDIGNNVRLRVEEFNPEERYEDDNEDEDEEESSDSSYEDESVSQEPPPGTQAGGWYQVLNELRQEQDQRIREEEKKSGDRGLLVGQAGRVTAATPLKLFPSSNKEDVIAKALDTQSVESVKKTVSESDGKSRHEVWSSIAPPPPLTERDYHRLQYVSAHPVGARHFKPPALTFHAAASYINAADKCRRILVYGGIGMMGKSVEQELYEYSLLTFNWRRVEGKQFVPAGHYAHALAVVEPLDKLVLIGGIGPGGILSIDDSVMEDSTKASRANYLFPIGCRTRQMTKHSASGFPVKRGSGSSANVGFVPYVFDMTLSTQVWRAVQTSFVFPLAYHTTVAFGTEVFVFGGLSESLEVESDLIIVNVQDYTVRKANLRGKDEKPCGRFLHSAVRFGNYMIIFGGLNEKNECLNDAWAFDMVNNRWEPLPGVNGMEARAGHTAVVVGSRMLLFGGFDTSLEETTLTKPLGNVTEVNLVPTTNGEHVFKDTIRVKPKFPPVAFSTGAPCGDDASVFLFGGLTAVEKKKKKTDKKHRSQSIPNEGPAGEHDDREEKDDGSNVLLKQYYHFDDSLVVSFKPKEVKKATEEDEPHVNELGVEVDPEELPEHFKAFVRRQEDFVKKKQVNEHTTIKKIELEEKEGMEPTLYLTTEEIERLMQKSEECCDSFLNDYKPDRLPSNVPDRETRIHILEECVSLSRQVRDVMKSMKGSEAGITAVKSKSHRMRTGKFEDYSAAKPFRRAMINNLITNINHQLAHMHQLNKTLRTVDWEEKDQFVEAIQKMQTSVNNLVRTINATLNKYIRNRVESLMKGVDKHEEVMRQLREVVEKNRHDKIWGKEEVVDKQRERVKKEWKKGDKEGKPTAAGAPPPKTKRPTSQGPVRSTSRHRSQSLGAGFYKDEAAVSVKVMAPEWNYYLKQIKRIETTAEALKTHCQEGMAVGGGMGTAPSNSAPPALPPQTASPPPLPNPTFSNAPTQPPAMPLPGQPAPPSFTAPPPTLQGPSFPNLPSSPPPPGPPQETGEIGSASPKEVLIRHSNELRQKVIEFLNHTQQATQKLSSGLASVPPETVETKSAHKKRNTTPVPTEPKPLSLPPPASSTLFQNQNVPPSLPPGPKEEKDKETTVTQIYQLNLPVLRPLAQLKGEAEKLTSKVALIRQNNWDGNDLGGAPSDEKAIKLHHQLTSQIASLFQRMSASFLTLAGGKKRRAKSVGDGLKNTNQSKSRPASVGVKTRKAPSVSPTKNPATTTRSSSSSSSDVGGGRVRVQPILSNNSAPVPASVESRGVLQLPSSPPPPITSSVSAKGKTTTTTAKGPPYQSPKEKTMGKPKSKPLAPVPTSLSSHAVSLGSLEGREESAASTQSQTQAVPLLSMDVFNIPAATTTTTSTEGQRVPEVAPAGVSGVKTTTNAPTPPVPYWSSPAVDPAIAGTAKAIYANEWSVVNPQKSSLYDKVTGQTAKTAGTTTAAPMATPDPEDNTVGNVAVATGAGLIHIPTMTKEEKQEAAAKEKPRLSTILALTQMGGGKEMEDHRAIATSVAPGAFLVNADHFEERIPPVEPVVHTSTESKKSWADADEDYFYFGKLQTEKAAPVGVPTKSPEPAARKKAPVQRQYPTYTVSPPVGSTLASQNVNAQRKRTMSAKTKKSMESAPVSSGSFARRQTVSSRSKVKEVSSARDAERSHLTPGERKILEARERLSRRNN